MRVGCVKWKEFPSLYIVEFHGPQIDPNLQIERFREKIEKKKTKKKKKRLPTV